MAFFKYLGRGRIEANGYVFLHDEVTEVRDDDTETLQKLRGRRQPHPSFKEVNG